MILCMDNISPAEAKKAFAGGGWGRFNINVSANQRASVKYGGFLP